MRDEKSSYTRSNYASLISFGSLFLYWILLLLDGLFETYFFKIDPSGIIRFVEVMLSVNFMAILVVFIIAKTTNALNLEDYRIKMVAYYSIVMLLGITVGTVLTTEGLVDQNFSFNMRFFSVLGLLFVFGMITWTSSLLASINLVNPLSEAIDQFSNKVARKEFDSRITDEKLLNDPFFRKIIDPINQMADSLNTYINTLIESQHFIEETVDSLTSNVEEVTASSEEIASTSQNMADGAMIQAQTIGEVNNKVKQNEEVFSKLINDISTKIKEIDEITIQTNILALNAGIEASRAGDYGRGFAVVANNIRTLSDQAKEMSSSINETLGQISQTLGTMIYDISHEIENIATISEETSASAEESAATSREIAEALQDLNHLAMKLNEHVLNLSRNMGIDM